MQGIKTILISGFVAINSLQAGVALSAPSCGVTPACSTAAPSPKAPKGFLGSRPSGKPLHTGQDFYFAEGEQQWVIAQFQYGNALFKNKLQSEEVKIYLLRDCGVAWEELGTGFTSRGDKPTVLGIEDEGGLLYFPIPANKALDLGRHRISVVVSGDQSATELFIEVLPQGSSLFVSDVDGTLTSGEWAQGLTWITGGLPKVQAGAVNLFHGLAKKGYRPLYLTARNGSQLDRTRLFLSEYKFPAGIVQTSPGKFIGLSGDAAIEYKAGVLQRLADSGFKLEYGFGNTTVDANAYAQAAIPAAQRFFVKYDELEGLGGETINSYTELKGLPSALDLCQ